MLLRRRLGEPRALLLLCAVRGLALRVSARVTVASLPPAAVYVDVVPGVSIVLHARQRLSPWRAAVGRAPRPRPCPSEPVLVRAIVAVVVDARLGLAPPRQLACAASAHLRPPARPARGCVVPAAAAGALRRSARLLGRFFEPQPVARVSLLAPVRPAGLVVGLPRRRHPHAAVRRPVHQPDPVADLDYMLRGSPRGRSVSVSR